MARTINQINSIHQKQAILFFNDLDNDKILHLKAAIDSLDLQYVKILVLLPVRLAAGVKRRLLRYFELVEICG